MYDVSTDDGTAPTVGRYDGDTSIYCPVAFANGKLSIGSKKHKAVYQNRYYYMKSDRHFRAFVANPDRYASFTVPPETCPKPKISLYCPLGVDVPDSLKNVLYAYDSTLADAHEVFRNNVLPDHTPMLGEMYEEPTLRDAFDEYFASERNDRDHVNGLREYIDRKSARLSDGDWVKMNSPFSRIGEGVCYRNYPANSTELAYLKANDTLPDVFVQVTVADGRAEREHAKRAVGENWSAHRYGLMREAVARDERTRRNDVAERSATFKKKLAQSKREKRTDDVRTRLRRVVLTMATETERGPNATDLGPCDSPPSPPPPLPPRSRNAALTLKQKKIVIRYGLDGDDFRDLDDLAVLERIDETIRAQVPAPERWTSKCFRDGLGPSSSPPPSPPDALIERLVRTDKSAVAAVRESVVESGGVPWLTVPADGRDPGALDALAKVLSDVCGRGCGALETAYAVDPETAERMLCAGEAHLSRFGRGCPVDARRRPDSAPRFYADLVDGRACPAVYRRYVYFTSGPENRDEFLRRPLEYARGGGVGAAAAAVHLPALRIAVLGPPRSGKSRCALDLCREHGLQPVRVDGPLVRAYLAECGWTDGAADAWARLRRGDAVDDVTLAAAVDWATKGARAVAHGYVLDGYPVTENQVMEFI